MNRPCSLIPCARPVSSTQVAPASRRLPCKRDHWDWARMNGALVNRLRSQPSTDGWARSQFRPRHRSRLLTFLEGGGPGDRHLTLTCSRRHPPQSSVATSRMRPGNSSHVATSYPCWAAYPAASWTGKPMTILHVNRGREPSCQCRGGRPRTRNCLFSRTQRSQCGSCFVRR
jgi:hypothetical protein